MHVEAMTLTMKLVVSALLLSALMLFALPPSATQNFVVKVVLLVNGVEFEGQGVWQTTLTKNNTFLGNALRYRSSTRGEAIPIPISEDVVAFAILRPAGSPRASFAYGDLLLDCGVVTVDDMRSFSGGCDVKSRPEIVVAVGQPPDNGVPPLLFASSGITVSGLSISLLGVSVTTTDRHPTFEITSTVPWLKSLPSGYNEHGVVAMYPDTIYQLDFSRRGAH